MGKTQTFNGNGIPAVLKRNMACHQCRKRKLKCDAQKPCSTCKRSHANQLATALPGTDVPPEPHCTYDELPEPREPVEKMPGEGGIRAKLDRLESRIAELQNELRDKDQLLAITTGASGHVHVHGQDPFQSLPMLRSQIRLDIQDPFNQLSAGANSAYPTPFTANPHGNGNGEPSSMQQQPFTLHHPHRNLTAEFNLDQTLDQITGMTGDFPLPQNQNQSPGSASGNSLLTTATDTNAYTALLWPNWPERLPSPPLLQHLIETFFASHPHACRLLHRPTFMASLTLPPTHQDFPTLSLLHAICALASLWSPAVEKESMPDLTSRPAEEIYHEKERRRVREERAKLGLGVNDADSRGDWFGEVHAKWSREEEERNATEGIGVFQGLQSVVVLTWYYYAHARWAEVWLYTSKALRYAVPMGLNTTPTHGPLLRSWTMPSILGPPKDIIEAEMRRNTFWLAYCYERWQAASTGWAMALDDEDISQVLSLRTEDFENGLSLPTELRQRISTPRMLTLHIPEQTDSFTLYVKGTILFSKVKNFNIRFKSKYYYAVASSSAHGDRFGAFGGQSQPPIPSIPRMAMSTQDPINSNNSTIQVPVTIPVGSTSVSGSGPSRGPSPDMTPIANLATAGVLQDDPSLVTETRWHRSSAPSFPPATTGNPPPGPTGTYGSPATQGPERIDPRDTPSFRAVDGLIEGFRTSFPRDMRDPVAGGRVDSELYVACLVPHVATILLHDPHADPTLPGCKSADKLLIAARSILDLVYLVCATSFDITLLDPVASFAWFLAARVFVRLIKARLDMRKHAEAVGLRNELEVLRHALKRMGERVPLGYRQSKMLDDLLVNEIGSALEDPTMRSYAFATASPGDSAGSPHSVVNQLDPMGHRGSFSAQGQPMVNPNMEHRGSLSVPNMEHRGSLSVPPTSHSRRNSFSVQEDTMEAIMSTTPIPNQMNQLPEMGDTKEVFLHQLTQLPQFEPSVPSASESAGITGGVGSRTQTPFTFGVTEIHRRVVESMKPQDEREGGFEQGHPTGGRLEMLLGEMVDDGEGDGVFVGVHPLSMLGAMNNIGHLQNLNQLNNLNQHGLNIGGVNGMNASGIQFGNEFVGVGSSW